LALGDRPFRPCLHQGLEDFPLGTAPVGVAASAGPVAAKSVNFPAWSPETPGRCRRPERNRRAWPRSAPSRASSVPLSPRPDGDLFLAGISEVVIRLNPEPLLVIESWTPKPGLRVTER